MKKILLFSGGIDSYIAYFYLDEPQTVYFNTDIGYSKKEIEAIKELIPDTIIDDSLNLHSREIPSSDTAFIPMRNLYLAMLACKYGDEIIIAGLKDDVVNDKNKEIFEEFSAILSKLNEREIKVTSPFWDMTKADIVKWYLENRGEKDNLLKTISCYRPDLVQIGDYGKYYCGQCKCCFRKWVALWVNGIKLPFHNTALMNDYRSKAEQNHYIEQRNKNIIKAVEEYIPIASKSGKRIAIDIDGVLTKETEGYDYTSRTPNHENIAKVNKLFYRKYRIILWTSRYLVDEKVTKKWLQDNGVKYHELKLGKLPYDAIIDDKTTSLDELVNS